MLINKFLIRYYPRIYNFTSDRSEAQTYLLKELLDLKSGNTCDDEDPNIPESLTNKFAFARIPKRNENVSDSDVPTNCSIVERARLISVAILQFCNLLSSSKTFHLTTRVNISIGASCLVLVNLVQNCSWK